MAGSDYEEGGGRRSRGDRVSPDMLISTGMSPAAFYRLLWAIAIGVGVIAVCAVIIALLSVAILCLVAYYHDIPSNVSAVAADVRIIADDILDALNTPRSVAVSAKSMGQRTAVDSVQETLFTLPTTVEIATEVMFRVDDYLDRIEAASDIIAGHLSRPASSHDESSSRTSDHLTTQRSLDDGSSDEEKHLRQLEAEYTKLAHDEYVKKLRDFSRTKHNIRHGSTALFDEQSGVETSGEATNEVAVA